MCISALVWRHTSIFFVGQLLILLCAGLCVMQWSYTRSQPLPTSAYTNTPVASQSASAASAAPASSTPFWQHAAVVLQPFFGVALLILLGSSALFAGCDLLYIATSPADMS